MSLGFTDHNHTACQNSALSQAETYCADKGLKLTPVRKRVLQILLQGHKAMGAYDVLDVLKSEGLGSQPPVAYRAIDFLVHHGFVHKVEHLNAFVACAHPGIDHTPAFLICTDCDTIAETKADLSKAAAFTDAPAADFALENAVIEARGRCPKCQ